MTISYHTSLKFIKIWLSADGAFPPWKSGWLCGAGSGVWQGGVAEGRGVRWHHQIGVWATILQQKINNVLVSRPPAIEEA